MKRGGGRRYYRPADVDLLKGIRTLLYGEGYTIRGAQKILKDNGIAHVVGIGRGEVVVAAADDPGKAGKKTVAKSPPSSAPKVADERVEPPAARKEVTIVHELTPAQIDELRLVLTDLAAARRLLVPDQAK